jgi:hypothetical protein
VVAVVKWTYLILALTENIPYGILNAQWEWRGSNFNFLLQLTSWETLL